MEIFEEGILWEEVNRLMTIIFCEVEGTIRAREVDSEDE